MDCRGSSGSRRGPSFPPPPARAASSPSRATSAGTATARSGTSCSRRSSRRSSPRRPAMRASSSARARFPPVRSATGCAGWRRAAWSRCSPPPRRAGLPHPRAGRRSPARTPWRSRFPPATAARWSPTSRWAPSRTATVLAGKARPEQLVPFGGEQAYKAFALAVGLQLAVDALDAGGRARRGVDRRRARVRSRAGLRALADGVRLPGDAAGASRPGSRARRGSR